MSAQHNYSFGDFTLDLRRGALLKAGADVRLRPKSFEVLRLLVERHGQLVTKEEFLEAIWGRAVVTEGSLTQCLIDVRRAIGDDAQQVIRTVPRRGYILDVPVIESDGAAAMPAATRAEGPPLPADSRRPGRSRVPLVAAVVAVAAAATWWGITTRDALPITAAAPAPARAPVNSIAVLPFVNMSPEPDQDYFSDGISEEILNLLAQSTDLRVIARTSSFSFRGGNASVADIASKLNVAYVLEGSVRKSGRQLRITAQLIDAADSSHLWSETYERELDDTFEVQTEIASRVTAALKATVGERIASTAPDPEAHERLLRGQFFFQRRAPGDLERAVKYYEEAIAIDPGYARAWADLAGACGTLAFEDRASGKQWLARQGQAAQTAVDLDPRLAEARVRLAQYYFNAGDRAKTVEQMGKLAALDPDRGEEMRSAFEGFDTADLVEEQQRNVERDPLSSTAHRLLGVFLAAEGRFAEALAEFRQALELNPGGGSDIAVEMGRVEVLQKRYDEAYAEIERIVDVDGRDHVLALLHDAPGRRNESDAALGRLATRPVSVENVELAESYAWRGMTEQAFAALEASRSAIEDDRDFAVPPPPRIYWFQNEMRVSPFLERLHSDPRWARLMADPF